ncbi:GIY-YIG nuclease family protein [Acrocarpospora catenulata]|uniref:GIY-YIG nuclease family protein n=1 Tax=Acrocarpospora catenulata TaxID=2836182 RepID=UPI001BDA1A54|nr:GIY-YIG nuclease family protein [Acrocarpospora catenulata]
MAPIQRVASGEIPLPRHGANSYTYRIYDSRDEILYVGVTDDLFLRMVGHRQSSPWWYSADRIAWDQYPTRQEAEIAERRAIRDLIPLHNVRDNGRRAFAAQMGHCRPYDGAAWKHFGEVLRSARETARRTQKSVAADARVAPAEYRALERGESTSYKRELLLGVEYALGWREGSIEAVLGGGEPTPLTEAEWAERLRRAHDAIALGDVI